MRNAASLALVLGLVACGPSIPPEQTLRNLQEVRRKDLEAQTRPLRIVCAGDSLTRGNQSGKVPRVKATDELAAAKPNLQQAGVGLLAQANVAPETVLDLLT